MQVVKERQPVETKDVISDVREAIDGSGFRLVKSSEARDYERDETVLALRLVRSDSGQLDLPGTAGAGPVADEE